MLDITPTVIHYLGFAVARDMDGRVLEGIFEPRFRDQHPVRYVDTYEDQAAAAAAATPVAEELDAEELADQERALRALGYLGGSSSGDRSEQAPVPAEAGSYSILKDLLAESEARSSPVSG
ncbi:MAG: hypothetical protein V3S30_01800 [Thermoanaerobaculia bacterium]